MTENQEIVKTLHELNVKFKPDDAASAMLIRAVTEGIRIGREEATLASLRLKEDEKK